MQRIIAWVRMTDTEAYQFYIGELQQGKYLGLRDFCLWIGLPVPVLAMLLGIAYIASHSIGYRSYFIETLAYLLASAINLIIKGIHKRNRPPKSTYWSVVPFDQFSFPSGHAAGTMSVAVCLGIATTPHLLAPLLVWSVLIGASRFLGGYHHLSDVIIGFAVGILSAFGLLKILALW